MAKILLVEDDLSISKTIKSRLEKEKYVVETTASGREGLELLLHFNFDLLILDWQLPDLSGPEVAKALQESRKDVPILMLTSKGSLDDRLHGQQLQVGQQGPVNFRMVPERFAAIQNFIHLSVGV